MPESPVVPHVESPKGTIRLYPADERMDGPPFYTGMSLGEALEEKRMNDKRRRLRVIALRLAYNVVKTPQEFITNDQPSDKQLWSVMPDVPSSSSKYQPVSKHPSRDEAVRALKKSEKTELAEKLQKKEEQEKEAPGVTQEQPKAEPVVRAQQPKEMQEQGQNDFQQPPEESEPVVRAQPPAGMTPEEQAKAQPKKRSAGRKRRWSNMQQAAREAWNRR